MNLGVTLGIHRGVRASTRVEPCTSALLSSRKSSVKLPVWWTIGFCGFLLRSHRVVILQSCFKLVLGVTVDSVAGKSGVSGMYWDIGIF